MEGARHGVGGERAGDGAVGGLTFWPGSAPSDRLPFPFGVLPLSGILLRLLELANRDE